MTDHSQPSTPGEGLPESVDVLTLGDRTIYLVGTAHVSSRSVDDVREVIEAVAPDTVCVELDEARHKALVEGEAWRELDVVQVVRRKQATLLLTHLILAAFQRRMGEKLGVRPGAEMLQAVQSAESAGAALVLADRDIRVTLRRTWSGLTWWDKLRLAGQLMTMLVISPDIGEEEIEQLKEKDMLSQVMENFASAFPRAKETLISERDLYLVEKVRSAPGNKIVAVVGAGHIPGMLEHLEKAKENSGNDTNPIDLAPLMVVPPPGLTGRVIKWGIPALVLGLIAYGFLMADASVSLEMIKIWVLANGILAALGALLAFAHPLTIAAAFVAAPLTSLNPMVAAGWVAGLCEAALRRPRVRDFEALPNDIVSFKGFWRNGITRILLVVALANLGSTAGTFIGLPLMTRLLG